MARMPPPPAACCLVALLTVLAGCGGERPALPPLGPPDPAAAAIRIAWPSGRMTDEDRFEHTHDWVLELLPTGRFLYSWRTPPGKAGETHALAGTWHQVGLQRWALEPDTGRDALEPDCFDADAWPTLRWSGNVSTDPGGPVGNTLYFIPAVVIATGRIDDSFVLQSDPRIRERLEAQAGAR